MIDVKMVDIDSEQSVSVNPTVRRLTQVVLLME